MTYVVKRVDEVLFEGSLIDCWKYVVAQFGQETMIYLSDIGLIIEPKDKQ